MNLNSAIEWPKKTKNTEREEIIMRMELPPCAEHTERIRVAQDSGY